MTINFFMLWYTCERGLFAVKIVAWLDLVDNSGGSLKQ